MSDELIDPKLKDSLDAELEETRNIARKYAKDVMVSLCHICLDKKNPPSVRIQAAMQVMDRAFGKPGQTVEVNNKNPNNFIGILRELRPTGEIVTTTVTTKEDNQLSLLDAIKEEDAQP